MIILLCKFLLPVIALYCFYRLCQRIRLKFSGGLRSKIVSLTFDIETFEIYETFKTDESETKDKITGESEGKS